MTREEFIEVLKKEGYSYEIVGGKIIITDRGPVDLDRLTSIPSGVAFKNGGGVYLMDLASLPPGVVFKNEGRVELVSLTSLPPGVKFSNGAHVILNSLTSLPSGVVFKNKGDVYLKALTGGWFDDWRGNIKGIDSKRLLNSMISKGLFER